MLPILCLFAMGAIIPILQNYAPDLIMLAPLQPPVHTGSAKVC